MTVDLAGRQIGRLTVVKKTAKRSQSSIVWECKCECGNTVEIASRDLLHYDRKGCGNCKDREHELYSTYRGIISRCEDSNNPSYKHYGGRGISMCSTWRNNFLLFVADVGKRPSREHSIDRVDVDGNYEPSNCRWADAQTQCNNKRDLPRKLSMEQVMAIYYTKDTKENLANHYNVSIKTIQNIKCIQYRRKDMLQLMV